jgi:hypothetical protein
MSIRQLDLNEVEQVSGGLLTTQFVQVSINPDYASQLTVVKRPPITICMVPPCNISCMIAKGPIVIAG